MRSETGALPGGLRVLLVEDEPLIGFDTQTTLQSFGVAHVTWVRGAADALSKIETETFNAAILDLQLGGESSLPLAQRLEELGVPYGFVTGHSDKAIPPEFRDRPVVSKPFTGDQIHNLLHALVAPAS